MSTARTARIQLLPTSKVRCPTRRKSKGKKRLETICLGTCTPEKNDATCKTGNERRRSERRIAPVSVAQITRRRWLSTDRFWRIYIGQGMRTFSSIHVQLRWKKKCGHIYSRGGARKHCDTQKLHHQNKGKIDESRADVWQIGDR